MLQVYFKELKSIHVSLAFLLRTKKWAKLFSALLSLSPHTTFVLLTTHKTSPPPPSHPFKPSLSRNTSFYFTTIPLSISLFRTVWKYFFLICLSSNWYYYSHLTPPIVQWIALFHDMESIMSYANERRNWFCEILQQLTLKFKDAYMIKHINVLAYLTKMNNWNGEVGFSSPKVKEVAKRVCYFIS